MINEESGNRDLMMKPWRKDWPRHPSHRREPEPRGGNSPISRPSQYLPSRIVELLDTWLFCASYSYPFPKEKHFLWLCLLPATLHLQCRGISWLIFLVCRSPENEKPCMDLMVLTVGLWEVLKLEVDAVTGWGIRRCDRMWMAISSLLLLDSKGRI